VHVVFEILNMRKYQWRGIEAVRMIYMFEIYNLKLKKCNQSLKFKKNKFKNNNLEDPWDQRCGWGENFSLPPPPKFRFCSWMKISACVFRSFFSLNLKFFWRNLHGVEWCRFIHWGVGSKAKVQRSEPLLGVCKLFG
jgi:hypothetical protein